ncbi:MAG: 6-bladed beta-propeller [Thaumarchaeota archaeon]|nr:6-bladed beta-propeller [Nitrososphaerota archaeon]
MKTLLCLLLFFAIIFTLQEAYATEIIANPLKNPFGSNDWIQIELEIDGYVGGIFNWNATKPDQSTISGELSNFKYGKTTHVITRSAFDNQFGTWMIRYYYNDIVKTVTAEVEPLTVKVTTDKENYFPGDIGTVTLTTNYFEPISAKAYSYKIEIHNENGELASQTDSTTLKVYQISTTFQFTVNKLIKFNPPGIYTAVVQYFNLITKHSFTIGYQSVDVTIFLGSHKSHYKPGEIAELNIVVTEILNSDAILKITDPSGKMITRTLPITTSSTDVILNDVDTTLPGSYQYALEYGGATKISTFIVIEDKTESTESGIELSLTLDKKQYRPGEAISATFQTNKITEGQIFYWFEDPLGAITSIKTQFSNPTSGIFSIPYVLSPETSQGPWKMYVDYGGTKTFAIFFVAGEPVEGPIQSSLQYDGPELLLTIDGSQTNFQKIQDIGFDSEKNLYVVDSSNSKIHKFNSNGNFLLSWGAFGSGEGQLNNPSGIFINSDTIHVIDKGNSRIVTFDKDGNFKKSWGNLGIESQSLKNPEDLTIDSLGISYVSDSGWNKILKFDQEGKYVGDIKSLLTSAAKFSATNSIVSYDDNLFILVSNDNRILHFLTNGAFIKSFGTTGEENGKLILPTSLALDSSGNLYVADSGNHRIQVFDSNGKFLKKWGTFGAGFAQFIQISGIEIDSIGNVWTSDSSINKIQKFAPFNMIKLTIPDWIKNNANWWADDQISDDDFASGIQFMIKQSIIVIPELGETEETTKQKIPDWIKNNARWWSEEKISDEDFANGIEYMVKNGIIQV